MERLRARADDGFVVPAAVAVLAICLLLVAAAAMRSISANDTSVRTQRSQRALQAADTGLRMARYRLNGLGLDLRRVLSLGNQCLVNAGSLLDLGPVLSGSQWCDGQTEDLGNGESVTYYSSALIDNLQGALSTLNVSDLLSRKIVAIGTACAASPCTPGSAGSVSRRVRVQLQSNLQITNTPTKVLGITISDTLTTNLQLYAPVKGSYHECSPALPADFAGHVGSGSDHPSNPEEGC
jgi:type II secretory pathway pseudopilin PulG